MSEHGYVVHLTGGDMFPGEEGWYTEGPGEVEGRHLTMDWRFRTVFSTREAALIAVWRMRLLRYTVRLMKVTRRSR